jgi:long-chain fatty acid transport protein
MKLKKIVGVLATIGITAPGVAMATNGMLMEGYGPIATSMGGASMAYDNGAAGMANNPATIGMMANGTNRLDLAIGGLHPDIDTKMAGMPNAHSDGDAYYMPAVGWVKKNGKLAYGVGVFAQGGMGTEYGTTSWLSAGTGLENRSEVGVGNLIVPLSYDVSPDLNIGGSVDFVWAGMDLKMLMSGGQLMDMMPNTLNPFATHSGGVVGGNMMTTGFAGAMAMMNPMNPVNYGYFDFSNSNDFSGKAHSTGWAGKLGFTYKFNKQLTMGGTYHSSTSLSDMEGSASLSFNTNMDTGILSGGAPNGVYTAMTIPLSGKIAVRDFQFPETYGLGLAFQANDKLMIAADYKRINWSKAMKDFKMTFTADATQANMLAGGFAGQVLDATMYQNWDDQDVFMLGMAYKATDALTLRAGVNLANNPIPDAYVNPLFPATIKDHYTLGAGYAFSKVSEVNASYVYAPKVTANAPASAGGYSIEHAQNNWQLMYSHRF